MEEADEGEIIYENAEPDAERVEAVHAPRAASDHRRHD